jgi:hypothetical protein
MRGTKREKSIVARKLKNALWASGETWVSYAACYAFVWNTDKRAVNQFINSIKK